MMKQLTIRKHLLIVAVVSSCLVWVQCSKACNHSNLSPTQPQQATKKRQPQDALLCVRQSADNRSSYIEIIVCPPKPETELSQYSIIASNLKGKGDLLAAVNKIKGKLQYSLSLKEETKLDKVYLSKGNAVLFKQGKPIKMRCRYQTDLGTQQGEVHQIQIKLCVYDSSHQISEQQVREANFHITQPSQPQEPQVAKRAKKSSAYTSKKGRQPQDIGQ